MPLEKLYSISHSNFNNQTAEYCPLILKVENPRVKGELFAEMGKAGVVDADVFLIQLWNSKGILIYERYTESNVK